MTAPSSAKVAIVSPLPKIENVPPAMLILPPAPPAKDPILTSKSSPLGVLKSINAALLAAAPISIDAMPSVEVIDMLLLPEPLTTT